MDGVTVTSVPDKKDSDGNPINSLPQIIIKRENIGLEEYQHQKYQYNLFNNLFKHDQYYEDLNKVKDRLEKTVPNMQQVIHMDMKRANINKIYERKLNRDLTGPRGLNWQCRQELQRLQNEERDIERDLIRLNRDLAKIASSPPLLHQNKDLFQSQIPHLSLISNTNPMVQTSQKTKPLLGNSFSVNTNRSTVNRFIPIDSNQPSINETNPSNEKSLWIHKQLNPQTNKNHRYFQQHAHTINQQNQEIEQKLKKFLF